LGRTIDIHYNNASAVDRAKDLKLSVLLETDSFFYWATNERNEVLRIEQVDGTDLSPLYDLGASELRVAFSHGIGYMLPEGMHSSDLPELLESVSGSETGYESFSLKGSASRLYLPKSGVTINEATLPDAKTVVAPMASYFFFPGFVAKEGFQEALVHLHFMEHEVFLAAYRGGKLLLWQVIPLSSAYELQYFTLLVFYQFHMDRQQVPLLLSGRIAAGSQLYHLLYPYFSRIQWAQFPGTEKGPVIPGTIPAHYLADLWLIHQCVL